MGAERSRRENRIETSIRRALTPEVPSGTLERSRMDALYYRTGQRIGGQLSVRVLEEIPGRLQDLGLGRPKLVAASPDLVLIHWFDCLTCSGLPPVGKALCHLEAGILAGSLRRVMGLEMEVEETRCWGLGDRYCEMRAAPRPSRAEGERDDLRVLLAEESDLLVSLTLQAVQEVKRSRLSASRVAGQEIVGDVIFERMPVGMMVTDDACLVLKANRACQSLLGISPLGAARAHIRDFLPESRAQRVLATGRPEVWKTGGPGLPDCVVLEMPLGDGGGSTGVLVQVMPVHSDLIRLLLGRLGELEEEVERYREQLHRFRPNCFRFNRILSVNPRMKEVLALAEKVAQTDATVLLLGESGTGKEVLARAIHAESRRNRGPFVKVDCASLPEHLIESELFGYEEGAFTGARRGGKPGKLEVAGGGTLFLDEIGDLPFGVQAKLLRVIEEREFERLGGTCPLRVDARIMAATNRDLEAMVESGRFRSDLFYRLDVVKITLCPLRERLDDLPLLVEEIGNGLTARYGRPVRVNPQLLRWLAGYAWPGNVRELENVLEHALIVAGGEVIGPADLPERVRSTRNPPGDGRLLREAVAEAEKRAIIETLKECGGNRSLAARRLGISRQALYARLRRMREQPR